MMVFAYVAEETDSFNPIPTTLADFERDGMYKGQAVLSQRNQPSIVQGVLSGLEEAKCTERFRPIFSAHAGAGGRITDDALEFFHGELMAGVRGLGADDAVFLAMHGAMSSERLDDTEGYLLRELRAALGSKPLVVAILDHHANITREMMTAADVVIGFDSQPHDPAAAGLKAARVFRRVRAAGGRPATAWRKIPMIAPQDGFLTTCPGPMKEWFDMARAREQDERVFSIAQFPMQPWLDVAEGGWAVVVHTVANEAAMAERLADELAEAAWERRDRFWISERVAPAEAVQSATAAAGLTLISDTGDAVLGGAPGDSSVLLSEILRPNVPAPIFLPLVDPEATDAAHRAGAGQRVRLRAGGWAGRDFYGPIAVDGIVRALSGGFAADGLRGPARVGRCALIEAGAARLVLLDARTRAIVDPSLYTGLGLRIEDARAVVMKTGSNFQAFAPWRPNLVRADTPGITQSRLQDLPWRKLPRPIYPFDPMHDWREP